MIQTKKMKIGKSLFVGFFALPIITLAALYFGSLPQITNIAQANQYCGGMELTVNVYDVTAGQPIGSYYSNELDGEYYDLSIPYNHVIRYEMISGGTPSFTSGRFYMTDDGYTHSEHTWAPDPTPGMSNLWTAPEIRSNGFAFFRTAQNSCTPAPPGYPITGDISAEVIFGLHVGADFILNCTPAHQTVTAGSGASFQLATTPTDGFNDPVTFSYTMNPDPAGAPSIDFTNNGATPSATTVANVTTSSNTPIDTYSIRFTGTGGGKSHHCDVTFGVNGPQLVTGTSELAIYQTPYVSLTANGASETTIQVGNSAALQWGTVATHNGQSCDASGAWNGTKEGTPNVPHSGTTGVLSTVGDYTYTLTCHGALGSLSDPSSATVHVTPNPVPPTATLYCVGSSGGIPTTGPCNVESGSAGDLTWSSTPDATGCAIDNGISPTPPPYTLSPNSTGSGISTGDLDNPPITTRTYTLTCVGPGGTSLPSSVTINVIPVDQGSWEIVSCAPFNHEDQYAGSTNVSVIETSKTGNFTSPVTFQMTGVVFTPTGDPGDYDQPVVTLTPETGQVPPSFTTATFFAPSGTGTGTYRYTFTGTGGGITDSCYVWLEIIPRNTNPPQPPTVTANNAEQCDQVRISWTPNLPPTPDKYELYRGIPFRGRLIATTNPATASDGEDPFSFVDTRANGAQENNNYYYVIAYVGNTASGPGLAGPANVRPCLPNMSTSDKDLIQVVGKYTATFAPNYCSGTVPNEVKLPPGALFTVGDVLTFEIHVCNSGPADATNVIVKDKLYNPRNVNTQYNLIEPRYVSSSNNCASEIVPPASDGDRYTIDFAVPLVRKAGKNGPGICSIKFTAKIDKPANPTGQVFRFQNTGIIQVPGISDTPYFTPPYLFSLGGIPDRQETAPQQ